MSAQTVLTGAPTLVDLLRRQAERYQDKVAFRFCPDGDDEQGRVTYRELDVRARVIAARLQDQGAAGQRVLVLCPPGLDSIAGIFGCLYAGAVAVPVDEHWASPRIAAIVPDARAQFALATAKTEAKMRTTVDGLIEGPPLHWHPMDPPGDPVGAAATDWAMPTVDPDTTAMLQYTSGSSGIPKGAVVTHRNLLHNLDSIRHGWDPRAEDPVFNSEVSGVSWLPNFHDMGLIGGVLGTLYGGRTTVLMSPGAFLMRPMRWLQAMSRYRAVITAAPNYAYDWCVKRSTPEERAALDLSNWSVAVIGAEPIRATTLKSFAEAFGPAGFRPQAFRPAYGQVEATMGISGLSDSPVPVIAHVARTALEEDRVVDAAPDEPTAAAVVGCGRPRGSDVVIVDPDTKRRRGADEVGEIWVAGASVTGGYWHKPAETTQTYSAFLADTGQGPFLRTGDRGFLRDGELFVTGRCSDLMMIQGRYFYPTDIETTVQACDPALLPSRGAAFAVGAKRGAPQHLVVVQEVHRHRISAGGLDDIIDAVRAAIVEHHGIEAHDVLLVKPMRVPTTSSGKIQRGACRQLFVDGEMQAVAEWHAPPPPPDHAGNAKKMVGALKLAGLIGRRLAQQNQQSGRG